MRAVIQRVKEASVTVDNQVIGKIGRGLVVLLGVGKNDTPDDIAWTFTKIINLRIFPNEEGKFDQSLLDIHGEILLVSQFTLFADCRKGRRPSFDQAADPCFGNEIYLQSVEWLLANQIKVQCGQFAAMMDVALVNEGPVTIILDSKNQR